MSRLWQLIRRATIADALVVVAALSLGVALLYPSWSARAFRERVANAVADVDVLGAAARTSRDREGRWPARAAPGQVPPQLSELSGPEGIFARSGYTLEWTTWEVVDSVEAPPDTGPPPAPGDAPPDSVGPRMQSITRTVGAVAVHTGDMALLAELLEHYGGDASFVLDTMWLLVFAERSDDADVPPQGG